MTFLHATAAQKTWSEKTSSSRESISIWPSFLIAAWNVTPPPLNCTTNGFFCWRPFFYSLSKRLRGNFRRRKKYGVLSSRNKCLIMLKYLLRVCEGPKLSFLAHIRTKPLPGTHITTRNVYYAIVDISRFKQVWRLEMKHSFMFSFLGKTFLIDNEIWQMAKWAGECL